MDSQPGQVTQTHVELQTLDVTANPYLALGGMFAAGLGGLRKRLTLKRECYTDPNNLSEDENNRLA